MNLAQYEEPQMRCEVMYVDLGDKNESGPFDAGNINAHILQRIEQGKSVPLIVDSV